MKKFLATFLALTHLLVHPVFAQVKFSDSLQQIKNIENADEFVRNAQKCADMHDECVKSASINQQLSGLDAQGQSAHAPVKKLVAPIVRPRSLVTPVRSKNGMVVSASALANDIAVEVLNRGGNAVDAAVALGFAMSVTLPRAGGLGGGGFMLVYDAKGKKTRAIDYREMAPLAANANMYLNDQGEVDTEKKKFSYLSSAVPGMVKGFDFAYKLYGSMDWQELLQPAINLASQGFIMPEGMSESIKKRAEHLYKSEAARAVFFKNGDEFYEPGDLFVQTDLAKTLHLIATKGADEFYNGEIADALVQDMAKNGGLITREDLVTYRAVLREPLEGFYKGYKIVTMPPPSSGGVHLIQMLKILQQFPIKELGFGGSGTMHLLAESMRLAYADRSKYLGDTDFVDVPVKSLTSDLYARRLAKGISVGSATPSDMVSAGKFLPKESRQTTHFTIVDKWGSVVTNTYTLNFSYGNGHMVAGTGVLLNNQMDDFAAKVGQANAFGLIGSDANRIEPEKRPLSSMTPVIVFDQNDGFVMALGSPGGSRIISTVLQVILNVLEHNMNIAEAVLAPRMHHQWMPDELKVEKGFSPDTLEILKAKGHAIKEVPYMGAVMAVGKDGDFYTGAADTRRLDAKTSAVGVALDAQRRNDLELIKGLVN